MKIDKDDLCFGAIIGGLVICSPFIGLYHAGKWMYGMTPKEIKERKAKERKLEEMNRGIHELEKRLGLGERADSYTNYDPLYIGNKQEGREGYWSDLKKKAASGYKSPDLIWMIKEVKSGLCAPQFDYGDCQVLLLLHKDYYDILSCVPVERGPLEHIWNGSEGPGKLPRADCYVKASYEMMTFSNDYAVRLQTLSECGNYQDYYVYSVPGEFDYQGLLQGKCDELDKFLEDFNKKYKKNGNREQKYGRD